MTHNKKRNVGIIYELLVRSVSAYLVDNDKMRAQNALDIISKYYNKNSELYKEFRLFNALAKSCVKDTAVSAAILTESKNATRRFDHVKLDKEKTSLIHEINHSLVDPEFYFRNVPDYRTYATIQNLLNIWREGDRSNLAEVVLLETKMIDLLSTEKEQNITEEVADSNVDALVVKIMSEKFNSKYDDKLSTQQKDLIKEYVFSLQNDNGIEIKAKAIRIQNNALQELKKIRSSEKNQIILEKIDAVQRRVYELNFEQIDDNKLAKLMSITQLINELKGE